MKLPTMLPRIMLLYATAVIAACFVGIVNSDRIVHDSKAARGLLQTTTDTTSNTTNSNRANNETEVPTDSPASFMPTTGNISEPLEMWEQKGTDMVLTLDGNSLLSLAVSSDGRIVATGLSGEVQVYRYDSNGDDWLPLGQTLSVRVARLAMAATGRRIALSSSSGAVQVYEHDSGSNSWNPMESDILNFDNESSEPLAVAMSADGYRLVTRGYGNIPTRVYQFRSNNNDWTQLGQNMTPGGDDFGGVDMSADGNIIAVGFPNSDPSFVRVYRYNLDTDRWARLGNDIHGQFNTSKAGISVALSEDGDKIVVGDSGADFGGVVQLFEYNQTTAQWIQIGNNMGPINAFTYEAGRYVARSSSGTIVTYGVYGHGIEGAPHIAAFQFDANSHQWVQIGQSLLRGDQVTGQVSAFFVSVALALDGRMLVTGSIESRRDNTTPEGGSVFDGRVRVFTYGDTLPSTGVQLEANLRRSYASLCWPLMWMWMWMLTCQ